MMISNRTLYPSNSIMIANSSAKSLIGSNRPLLRRPAVLHLLVLVLGAINPATSAGLFSVRRIIVIMLLLKPQ